MARVQLRENTLQRCRRIMQARRELEQEAAEMGSEHIGDEAEVFDQRGSAHETLGMRDQLVDLDGVDELAAADLTLPVIDGRKRGDRKSTRLNSSHVSESR